ncbi:hypothetical protein [Halovivax sp.]|uniref:hypothetical protein n=1 Tax=Halovivax sp. TaxID=1935978 RepID=UPI0025B98BCE|nr:hypothetical protein [Halovivax sp.]
MRARQLVTIAVAASLLIGAGAALGAASPADQANGDGANAYEGTASDAEDENATDADDGGTVAASEDRAGTADGVGPSDGLPEQVPDRVSEIHDRIESFLSGSIESLGGALGELLGGDADDASDGNASADDGGADETESDA